MSPLKRNLVDGSKKSKVPGAASQAAPADGHGARGQAQEEAGEGGGEDGQDEELEQDPRLVPWGEAVTRPVVRCGVVDG